MYKYTHSQNFAIIHDVQHGDILNCISVWKRFKNTASDYMKLIDMSRPKHTIIYFYRMQDFQIIPITKSYSEPTQ
jgi:hypothetical protein